LGNLRRGRRIPQKKKKTGGYSSKSSQRGSKGADLAGGGKTGQKNGGTGWEVRTDPGKGREEVGEKISWR